MSELAADITQDTAAIGGQNVHEFRAPGDGNPEAEDDGFILKINDQDYDVMGLDLNEVEALEDLLGGKTMDEMNWRSAKTLKAAAFVFLRRKNPEITIDEAAAGIKFVGMVGGN